MDLNLVQILSQIGSNSIQNRSQKRSKMGYPIGSGGPKWGTPSARGAQNGVPHRPVAPITAYPVGRWHQSGPGPRQDRVQAPSFSKRWPTLPQHSPNMAPTWRPQWSHNASKIDAKIDHFIDASWGRFLDGCWWICWSQNGAELAPK